MMPPPRGRSRARQRLRTLTPMAAAVLASLGIIAALAFFVLPPDADRDSNRQRSPTIAAPTPSVNEPPTSTATASSTPRREPPHSLATLEPTTDIITGGAVDSVAQVVDLT